jgi:hypothetical protein
MRRYKDTTVGKASQLSDALEKSPEEAAKVYKATTEAFFALYGADAGWFISKHKENV